jgi:hypothetical protein
MVHQVPISAHGDPQPFGVDVSVPVGGSRFPSAAALAERAVDGVVERVESLGDELIRTGEGIPRIVDELGLDVVPPLLEPIGHRRVQ